MIFPSKPKEEPNVEVDLEQPTLALASQGVVIAEGEQIHFTLLGAIMNGNATIPLSNNKALRFTTSEPFFLKNGTKAHKVTIQIIDAGIGKEIKFQTWNRTKTKIVKEVVTKYKKPEVKVDNTPVQMVLGNEDAL